MDPRLGTLAVGLGLLAACGGVCGAQSIETTADLKRAQACTVIDGSLTVQGGAFQTVELPRLVEVTSLVAFNEVDEIVLPALEQVGMDATAGYVSILGKPSLVDLSSLTHIEQTGDEDPAFFSGGGLSMDAAPGADVDLSSLEVAGDLVFGNYGPADLALPKVRRITGLQVTGAGPYELDLPALSMEEGDTWIDRLLVADTTALERVSFGSTGPIQTDGVEVHRNEALVSIDLAPFVSRPTHDPMGVFAGDNAVLAELSLPSATQVALVELEDNPSLASVSMAAVEAVTVRMVLQDNAVLSDLSAPALTELERLVVQGNPSLSVCTIDAFVEGVTVGEMSQNENLEETCT